MMTILTLALLAQCVEWSIQDPAFETCILAQCDGLDGSVPDGIIQDCELALVEVLDCTGMGIESAYGIHGASSLRDLHLGGNNLLDVPFHPLMSQWCPDMRRMDLWGNGIEVVSNLVHQDQSVVVDLRGNPIARYYTNPWTGQVYDQCLWLTPWGALSDVDCDGCLKWPDWPGDDVREWVRGRCD